jgi:hypothetical protein
MLLHAVYSPYDGEDYNNNAHRYLPSYGLEKLRIYRQDICQTLSKIGREG